MIKIWANRLIDGDRWTWKDVPANKRDEIKAELKNRVENKEMLSERYEEIVGELYRG